ncbi:MAG: hypothetical protein ACQGVC_01875, partial [Myxococcota bacterium]
RRSAILPALFRALRNDSLRARGRAPVARLAAALAALAFAWPVAPPSARAETIDPGHGHLVSSAAFAVAPIAGVEGRSPGSGPLRLLAPTQAASDPALALRALPAQRGDDAALRQSALRRWLLAHATSTSIP